ncbi:MAG: PIN domain-containing protein [Candidatus Aenigmarchaeota archaeon]|nr:PIN domain-containing protein [Candidatus Aenigmarchaeota archaeon]
MRICADTWFLLELSDGENYSVKLLGEIEKGVHELFIPALALSEFFTVLYQKGMPSLAENIFAQLMVSKNIRIVPVDETLCIKIAKIKHSFGLSISDASMVAAYKITNSDVFLAKDSDFSAAIKQSYVKVSTAKDILKK